MARRESVSRPASALPTSQDDDASERTVWVITIRHHRYRGKVKPEGSVYLIRPDEVENHETLGVARRIPPPRTAPRPQP